MGQQDQRLVGRLWLGRRVIPSTREREQGHDREGTEAKGPAPPLCDAQAGRKLKTYQCQRAFLIGATRRATVHCRLPSRSAAP